MKHSRNSLLEIFKKLKFLKNFATGGHLRKGQKQSFSTLKFWHFEKNLKDQSDKNHFQKHMKHLKIFFGLIIKQLRIHTSHLNTYNHTNEIHIHWTLDMCVVCGNRVWISPLSSMKLQWWIQSSHTQIAWSQETYLTSRNEHIWPLTKVFT